MKPATRRRPRPSDERLMVLDPTTGALSTTRFGALAELLEPGDVCVVNDAATLPASLPVRLEGPGGVRPAEARVFGGDLGPRGSSRFEVLLFAGEPSRTPTEERAPPVGVRVGDRVLSRAGRLLGAVVRILDEAGRHVVVEREVDAVLLEALYAEGRAIGYAYLDEAPELWDVQTTFASRPWAAELPSAGRPLSFELLTRLRRRDIEVVRLTHGAGLSSSGRAEVDATLPRTGSGDGHRGGARARCPCRRGRHDRRTRARIGRARQRAPAVERPGHVPRRGAHASPAPGRRRAHRHARAGNEPLSPARGVRADPDARGRVRARRRRGLFAPRARRFAPASGPESRLDNRGIGASPSPA